MPENKKHHFVPRFYLRRFSQDGKSINIYNIPAAKVIHGGNLKAQCYRDYFYGKDQAVENVLAEVEGKTADLFRAIDERGYLPPLGSLGHMHLVMFLLLQSARTVYSVDALAEMSDKLMKHLIAQRAEAEGIDLNDFTIGVEEPAKFALGMAVQAYPLMLDLRPKLLINKTNQGFLTSDNPVVLYNQLFSFRRFGSNCGYASKGLQVFFPLDEERLIILYDDGCYSVGAAGSEVVEVRLPKDVYELNALQFCSASNNLYFGQGAINFEALHRKVRPYLRSSKTSMRVFAGRGDANRRSELVASSKEDIRTDLDLSFVRVRASARRWREAFRKMKRQPASVVRNPQLCQDHEEFMEKVREGEVEHSDFPQFMQQKYGGRRQHDNAEGSAN